MPDSPPLLEVSGLRIAFRGLNGECTTAVEGVGFRLQAGEGLAVVGESGSGKSVTALSLARLLPEPPALVSGSVKLDGQEVLNLSGGALRAVRGRRIAYIFQEPSAALNPVLSLRTQIGEVLRAHRPDVRDVAAECVRLLSETGIANPGERVHAYPHELSGGMQQRAMIAMAIAARPDLLIADEPTTALDVTTQKQVMELLADLKTRHRMAIILITHNFGIIRGIADRTAVMYRGRIVEEGPVEEVLSRPQHPYTRALIDCIPRPGRGLRRLPVIAAEGFGGG